MKLRIVKSALAALLVGGAVAGCATSVDWGGPLLHYRYNYDSRPVVSEAPVAVPAPTVTYSAPPVAYRAERDRIAANAAAAERKDAPAAPAASGRLFAAPLQEQAPDAVAKSASPLGTGHGRNESSYAQRVNFERATSAPTEVATIQYDRRDNLVAMGVLPGPRYAQRQPDAFPALRFAPDPR